MDAYSEITIRFFNVDLTDTLKICLKLSLYAYDAYFITCALKLKSPLLTLDEELKTAAKAADVSIIRIPT